MYLPLLIVIKGYKKNTVYRTLKAEFDKTGLRHMKKTKVLLKGIKCVDSPKINV